MGLPFGYWRYGQESLESYRIIAKEKENPLDLFNSKMFLLCRSIELTIKGFLLTTGLTEQELKGSYGHDLEKLLKRAVQENTLLEKKTGTLFSIAQFDKEVIKKVSPYYTKKEFEYIKEGFKYVPSFSDLESTARHLSSGLKDNLDNLEYYLSVSSQV